ncbi:MAG: hypothetical protein IJ611_03470 [Bacteroidales bacterium]|nr:hypothetical protein [Bacteroidales bacterium]
MKKRLILSLFLALAAPGLSAQDRARAEGQSLLFFPEGDVTAAEAGLRLRSEDDALLPAEGKGLMQGEFRARARHRLDSLQRVEGRVSYERGVKRSVNWNSTSDWRLLAPYVTVDTAGGNLQREQYRFYARYAARKGRILYGAAADYRALQEFRAVDPRPRNIVADLQVHADGGLLAGSHALSLEAGYRRYSQHNDIEFRDPLGNNTSVIHDLGFGRFSERFSGARSSVSVRFKGNGFSAQARWEPVRGTGSFGRAGYSLIRVDRHLPEQNETPVSRLLRQELSLSGGVKGIDRFLRADLTLRLKQGTEFIVDQTSAFGTLGRLPIYREPSLEASLTGFREWVHDGTAWSLEPRVGYSALRARSLYPGAGLGYGRASASVSGSTAFRRGDWAFRLDGTLGGALSLGHGLELPASAWGGERYLSALEHLAGRISDHAVQAGFRGVIAHPVGKDLRLYFRPEATFTWFLQRHWRLVAYGAIGIEF